MTPPRHLKVAACALILYGSGLFRGFAQTTPPTADLLMTRNLENGLTSVENFGPRMDFKFTKVPLTETIRLIQAQFQEVATPKYLNVIIGEPLRELAENTIITLDVKQVTVGELLKLIGESTQGNLVNEGNNGGVSGTAGVRFVPSTSSGGNPTYLLHCDYPLGYVRTLPSGRAASTPPPPQPALPIQSRQVSYFSLEPLLERYKVEDITTAMKLGWELIGATEMPTIKFHEETRLLVISANNDQMQVATQVIQNLGSGLPRLPSRLAPLPQSFPRRPAGGIPVQEPKPALPDSATKP